ncbi:MAG: PAS domain S-box protein [Thermodesulfovibrionia bacterium]|nr:PAS domain S-box protein [Thermodesulfovibrionia bacterium]
MKEKINKNQLETETALRVSEEKFRVLFESAIDGIFLLSDNGDVVDLNTSFAKMHGYTVAEMMKMNLQDLDTPESAKLATARLQRLFAGEPMTFEVEHYCKNGRTIPLEVSANLVIIGNEKYILGFHRDITERKRAEEALQESEKKYRVLVETMNEGLGIQDKNNVITYMNKRACEMFGYKSEELLGRPIDILFDEEGLKTFKAQMAQRCQGKEENYEVVWRRKDGGSVHTIVSPHVVFDAEGNYNGSFGVFVDITGRKLAEEERDRLNRELEIKNKELEQIIYAASHDLKTPLVNINGYSRELQKTLDDITRVVEREEMSSEIREEISPLIKELPDSFRFISTSVVRMDALLNGLLQFSRAGKVELKKEDIDMNMLINEILDNLNHRLKDTGASLEVTDLPQCTGDREQIGRIFSNLIENAVKYLDPSRKGEIKVTGYVKDNSSIYCVEDNGIGIAVDHQKQIFHIFHQLDPMKVGEGLGLAIVQRMVERHGGKVWLESEAGKGCRFFVALPA